MKEVKVLERSAKRLPERVSALPLDDTKGAVGRLVTLLRHALLLFSMGMVDRIANESERIIERCRPEIAKIDVREFTFLLAQRGSYPDVQPAIGRGT